jgi:hypothetical protein
MSYKLYPSHFDNVNAMFVVFFICMKVKLSNPYILHRNNINIVKFGLPRLKFSCLLRISVLEHLALSFDVCCD